MKMKKRIVVLLMALVLAVGLIGCKDTLKSIVHKASILKKWLLMLICVGEQKFTKREHIRFDIKTG